MPVTVPSMETVSFAAELTFGHFGSSSVMALEFSALKFIAHIRISRNVTADFAVS
jgi:hypothetical protein